MNQKVLQLMSLLGDVGQISPATANTAAGLKDTAQGALQAEAQKKAKEKEEKKKKGGVLGKIGATLAGVVTAPFTGGMSLAAQAALMGATSAAGGAAGELIGGGEVQGSDLLGYAAGGALAGGAGALMQNKAPVVGGDLRNAPVLEPLPAAGAAKPSVLRSMRGEIFDKRVNPIEGQGWSTGAKNIVRNSMDRNVARGYYDLSTPTSGRAVRNPITGELEEEY